MSDFGYSNFDSSGKKKTNKWVIAIIVVVIIGILSLITWGVFELINWINASADVQTIEDEKIAHSDEGRSKLPITESCIYNDELEKNQQKITEYVVDQKLSKKYKRDYYVPIIKYEDCNDLDVPIPSGCDVFPNADTDWGVCTYNKDDDIYSQTRVIFPITVRNGVDYYCPELKTQECKPVNCVLTTESINVCGNNNITTQWDYINIKELAKYGGKCQYTDLVTGKTIDVKSTDTNLKVNEQLCEVSQDCEESYMIIKQGDEDNCIMMKNSDGTPTIDPVRQQPVYTQEYRQFITTPKRGTGKACLSYPDNIFRKKCTPVDCVNDKPKLIRYEYDYTKKQMIGVYDYDIVTQAKHGGTACPSTFPFYQLTPYFVNNGKSYAFIQNETEHSNAHYEIYTVRSGTFNHGRLLGDRYNLYMWTEQVPYPNLIEINKLRIMSNLSPIINPNQASIRLGFLPAYDADVNRHQFSTIVRFNQVIIDDIHSTPFKNLYTMQVNEKIFKNDHSFDMDWKYWTFDIPSPQGIYYGEPVAYSMTEIYNNMLSIPVFYVLPVDGKRDIYTLVLHCTRKYEDTAVNPGWRNDYSHKGWVYCQSNMNRNYVNLKGNNGIDSAGGRPILLANLDKAYYEIEWGIKL